MKSTQKKVFLLERKDILITLIVIALFGLLGAFDSLKKIEYRMYDALLSVKPNTEKRTDIRLVNIDDIAIAEMGSWPWTRDVLADVLIRLKELGASNAVFDIEYLSPSQLGINTKMLEELPAGFSQAEKDINDMLTEFSTSVELGSITKNEIYNKTKELFNDSLSPTLTSLQDTITENILRDNDIYFSQAIRFFQNSWMTINAYDLNIQTPRELEDYVRENFLLNNNQVIDTYQQILIDNIYESNLRKKNSETNVVRDMVPSIMQVMQYAAGAGYTNVVVDEDGTRRRVDLLKESNSQFIKQLVFSPIVKMLDPEEIVRNKQNLTLKNALINGERKDLKIPLDEHGCMLINWIPDSFDKSFVPKNINIDAAYASSVYSIYYLDYIEEEIINTLKSLSTFKLRNDDNTWLSYYDGVSYLLQCYDDLNKQKNDLLQNDFTDNQLAAYFSARESFFSDCKEIFDPFYLNEILDRIEQLTTEENQNDMKTWTDAIKINFDVLKSNYDLYISMFSELKTVFTNSFCIIGNSGTGTTDLGVTPFWKSYPNVGTHANVYNTIMTQQFIKPLPWYYGYIISALLALLTILITKNKKVILQNLIGGLGIFVFPILSIALLSLFNVYLQVVIPTALMLSYFISTTVLRFIISEKDKGFLRQAFSTYLSDAVVDEIVNDPTKLTLGGEEKNITALFTDVKSFSTLSEKVTPTQLVSILNKYLTLFSDIILDNRGTIDKYEGDAIISFFGAPLSVPDHAWYACLSAIRMKQAEKEFNKEMEALGEIPMPLFTRIGINTGNMVVGNMGTDKKMNYTMMGNDVNLAARLEGVNKVYHSWILVSESTWSQANAGEHKGQMIARRLDKVRVIGIDKPVQLYNIVGLKDEIPAKQIESINVFHQGLDKYLDKEFVEAKKLFDQATELFKEDEQANVFSQRCTYFLTNGTPEGWNGVVNMTSK